MRERYQEAILWAIAVINGEADGSISDRKKYVKKYYNEKTFQLPQVEEDTYPEQAVELLKNAMGLDADDNRIRLEYVGSSVVEQQIYYMIRKYIKGKCMEEYYVNVKTGKIAVLD